MPQGEETFLYRVVTQLDDQEAFNKVSKELSLIGDATEQAHGSIQNLTQELQKMLPKSDIDKVRQKLANLAGPTDISGLKSMRSELEELEKSLDDGSQASKRLNKVIQGVDSANFTLLSENVEELKGDLQGVEPSFQDLQEQLERVEQSDSVSQLRKRFSSLQAMIRENEEAVARLKEEGNFTAFQQRVARIEDQLQDTKNTVAAAGGAIEKRLGTSLKGVNTQMDRSRLKTNQMSQAILQGAQDAQFGVIGVANNIQMLGEGISRQMNKGVSGFRLLSSTLSNLFMGPMAIGTLITAVTLLAQNFDKLPESVQNFADPLLKSLGLINTEFENLNEEVEKLIKKKSDDFSQLLKEAEGEQADLARERLKTLRESLQVSLKQLKARRDAITRETDIFKIRQRLVDNSKEITAESFSQIESAKTRKKIKQQANRILQRRKGLEDSIESSIENRQQQIKKTGERLRILNAEEIALDKTVSRVADKFQWTRDRAREWVKNVREGKEETGGADENAEDLLSTWQLLSKEVRSFVEEQEDITFDPTITFGSGQTNFDAYRKKLGLESQNILPPFARMKETIERRVEATGEVIESEADFDKELPDLMVIPGQGVITQKKFKEQQKEAQQIYKEEMAEFSAKQRQFQLETQRESPGESLGLFPGTSLQKEKELAQERLQIKLDHIKKVGNVEEGELQTTENLTEKEIQLWKNKEQRKTEIQRKFANKRTALQFQETQKIADQLTQNNPIARGTSQLITRLGATWDAFYNDRIEWEKMTTRKQAETVSRMGSQIVGAASNIASGVFDTWKQKRAQELKQQGKNAEERRKILKKEGKKRFQIMKALQIAEASANVAKGVTQALALPFPLNWAQAAAVSAAGAFRINQIAGLSIGDKLGGGSGGGSGQSSANLTGEFTQLTPDRNARRANNLANASRRSQATQRRSEADKMQRAAQKMDSAARKIQKTEVTYDDKTAEDITERGRSRQESLNI